MLKDWQKQSFPFRFWLPHDKTYWSLTDLPISPSAAWWPDPILAWENKEEKENEAIITQGLEINASSEKTKEEKNESDESAEIKKENETEETKVKKPRKARTAKPMTENKKDDSKGE